MSNRGFATKEGYEEVETRLRSSLASVLLWASERMPKEPDDSSKFQSCDEYIGWDAGVDDCRTLLINEAKKLVD